MGIRDDGGQERDSAGGRSDGYQLPFFIGIGTRACGVAFALVRESTGAHTIGKDQALP